MRIGGVTTRPWFDYVMGTRVVSSADLKETNPLSLPLPAPLSKALTQRLNRFSLRKWVEQNQKLVTPPVADAEQQKNQLA